MKYIVDDGLDCPSCNTPMLRVHVFRKGYTRKQVDDMGPEKWEDKADSIKRVCPRCEWSEPIKN